MSLFYSYIAGSLHVSGHHMSIFRRVRTAVHTTIGSVSVPLCSRALYVVVCLVDYSLLASREQSPRQATTLCSRALYVVVCLGDYSQL